MNYTGQDLPSAAMQRNVGMSAGTIGGAQNQIQKPRLSHQLDQLEKLLQCAHAHTSSIEQAEDRLLGPVPAEPSKASPTPPSNSIENRLAEYVIVAEVLCHRMEQAAMRLNQAV